MVLEGEGEPSEVEFCNNIMMMTDGRKSQLRNVCYNLIMILIKMEGNVSHSAETER